MRESLQIAHDVQSTPLHVMVLSGDFQLAMLHGESEHAAELTGLIFNHPAADEFYKWQVHELLP